MKPATVLRFSSERARLVADPERWVIGLDYKIPTLDPIHAVLRQKGKPARVIRLDPEAPPTLHAVGGRPS
jgi:hypothetical protein